MWGIATARQVCWAADSEQAQSRVAWARAVPRDRCDLDHPVVAWPGLAVIPSPPAHALLPIVRSGTRGAEARFVMAKGQCPTDAVYRWIARQASGSANRMCAGQRHGCSCSTQQRRERGHRRLRLRASGSQGACWRRDFTHAQHADRSALIASLGCTNGATRPVERSWPDEQRREAGLVMSAPVFLF